MRVAAVGTLSSVLSWRRHFSAIFPIPVMLAIIIPGSLLPGTVRHAALFPARVRIFVFSAVELPAIRAAGYRCYIIAPRFSSLPIVLPEALVLIMIRFSVIFLAGPVDSVFPARIAPLRCVF